MRNVRWTRLCRNFNPCAWLEPYIGRTGKACPRNHRKLLEADRRVAGRTSWPSNALRHRFASDHLAHFRDAAKLALQIVHTDQELIPASSGVGEPQSGREILKRPAGCAVEPDGTFRMKTRERKTAPSLALSPEPEPDRLGEILPRWSIATTGRLVAPRD